jgi:hypothetical protein
MKHSTTTQVHPMKKVFSLLTIAFLSLAVVPHAASAPSMLQFRLVLNNPTGNSEQMTVVQASDATRQPEVLDIQK